MTKNLRLLFFAVFLGCFTPFLAYAQGVFISPRTVFGTVNGITRPIPNATVTVCAAGAAGIPCSPALAGTLFKDSALTIPLANPFTADANGNYPTVAVAGGTYTITESASGFAGFSYQIVVACAPGPCAITSLTVTGPATITGALTAGQINNRIYVDGTKYPITQAGVQQAFTDACNASLFPTGSTTVYLPAANIALHNQATDLLHITCPLSIEGAGGQCGTNFVVDAGIASTISVIHYVPSGGNTYFRIKDVCISAAGATTAGDGLLLDGSSLNADVPIFIDIGPHFAIASTGSLNGYAINTANITSSGASLMWQIHENSLAGGIKLTNAADALSIRNNAINCSSSSTHADIELTILNGSAQDTITGNWAAPGCAGGAVIVHQGGQLNIEDNQFEQGIATTEANSAMIDLQGDVGALADVLVRHNNLNSHNNATNMVRVDHATNTHIEDNIPTSSSATGVFILLTANATNTRFPWNDTSGLSGGAIVLSNASATTTLTAQGADGSETTPSYASANFPNYGMYFRNTVTEISAQGVASLQVGPNGITAGQGGGTACTQYANGSVRTVPPDVAVCRAAPGFAVLGTNTGNANGIFASDGNTVALTADWTCGTGGTVASCVAATIIGSGGGVPLTFTLPSVARSWTWECDGVVGQATAATANQWNILTATNGATNVTANYTMATAATAYAAGAVTDQASTTTTFQIAPSWTLGGTGTKMPFHIWGRVQGASASGTVLSLQLVAPTVGDLVTIFQGTSCRIR